MSDGHWEAVRGSHHPAQGDAHSESASGAAGTGAGAGLTRLRVRHATDVIIGWRVWGMSTGTSMTSRSSLTQPLQLVSVFMNSLWSPGQPMKACCGADNARHGIHAFDAPDEAVQYMGEARKPMRYVFGEVSLWGRVVVHERGYRAEFAYPRHIFVSQRYCGGRDFVGDLRRTYGVEADWTS